jgi:hypothetical protein
MYHSTDVQIDSLLFGFPFTVMVAGGVQVGGRCRLIDQITRD